MAAAALDPPPSDCGMIEKGADIGEDGSVVEIVVVIDQVELQRRIKKKNTAESTEKKEEKNLKKLQQNCREENRGSIATEPQRNENKRVGGGSRGSGQKGSREDPIPSKLPDGDSSWVGSSLIETDIHCVGFRPIFKILGIKLNINIIRFFSFM